MNRFEIIDILKSHQEHYRVLPTGAMLAIQDIIQSVDADKDAEKLLSYSEWEQVKLSEQKIKTLKETAAKPVKKESPAESLTVGKVAKKKAKKKGK